MIDANGSLPPPAVTQKSICRCAPELQLVLDSDAANSPTPYNGIVARRLDMKNVAPKVVDLTGAFQRKP
jgi:hypothetical protein